MECWEWGVEHILTASLFTLHSPHSIQLCVVEKSACKDNISCTTRKFALNGNFLAVGVVDDNKVIFAVCDKLTHIRNGKAVALVDVVVIAFINECKGKNAGIDEISTVNTCKGLYNNGFHTEVERCKSSVFTGRTLTVVDTAHNNAAAKLFSTCREVFVTDCKAVFGDCRDIGTQGKNFSTCRHDMVCCNVVAYFERAGNIDIFL